MVVTFTYRANFTNENTHSWFDSYAIELVPIICCDNTRVQMLCFLNKIHIYHIPVNVWIYVLLSEYKKIVLNGHHRLQLFKDKI
mgnify:CR=1 FL=1